MMISPNTYYEHYLKGKNLSEVMTQIRSLKNKIGYLKNKMSRSQHDLMPKQNPSDSVILICTRLYLAKAKETYMELGGIYLPSRAEIKAAKFQENIPEINKIVFYIGGYFGGYETKTYIFDDEYVFIETKAGDVQSPTPPPPLEKDGAHMKNKRRKKEAFLDGIRNLHIGEWKRKYVDLSICDGEQWSLEIYFSNDHKPVRIYGNNAYPYNFEELKQLLLNS